MGRSKAAFARENGALNWINDTFGTELSSNVQLGIMFGALLLALFILLWLFRRIFGSAQSRIARNRQPRLGVIEAAIVDDTRRLVLVRRDNTEHLLMIGGPGDVVIETGIGQNDPARKEAPAAPAAQAPAVGQAAPETTPREPRLIEPLNDGTRQAPAPQQARSETTPAGQAATGAAAAAVTVAASKAAEAVEEVRPPVGEPTLETPQSETPESEMQESKAPADSDANPDSAEEITGEIAEELDTAAVDTPEPASDDEDTTTDTEEDMQKLLDELAGSKK